MGANKNAITIENTFEGESQGAVTGQQANVIDVTTLSSHSFNDFQSKPQQSGQQKRKKIGAQPMNNRSKRDQQILLQTTGKRRGNVDRETDGSMPLREQPSTGFVGMSGVESSRVKVGASELTHMTTPQNINSN